MKTTRRPFIRSTSRWIPFGLLGLSLTASIAVAAVVHRLVHMIDERRFARHVQINHDRVVGRLDIYVSVLRATKGLFAAEESVTLAKFRSFAEQLELRTLYPGIQAIGFVQRVLAAKREEFVTECQAEFPGFRIWPDHSTDEHYVVRYLDPLDGVNAEAIGYDMSSESVRLEAIERARATDAPAMSGKLTLVQDQFDARKQAGVLLFVPLYRYAGGQSTFVGVASAPLRADDLFRGIFGSETKPTIAFMVYDEAFAPENLLHASAGTTLPEGRGFIATDSLEIAGRRWVVRYAATDAFMATSLQWLPWVILVVGNVLGSALSLMSLAQVRGQRELQESEEHTRAIVESALDAVITIDDSDRITDWNRQAEAIFGWTKDEAMGRQLAHLIIPSGERAAHLQGVQRYLATGVGPVLNRRIELSALRRDGSEFPVEISISPSRVRGNISFTGYLRDITERKRSQEAMKLHSLVLERMVEGVSVADEKGVIVYTNAAEDSIFGYAPGELIGQPVTVQNALPPEENERLVGEVIATLQTNGTWSGEWRNRRKDGTVFLTSAHINTLEQDGHRLFVCVQQDITESKLAAQAAEANEQRFRAMADNIAQLAWTADATGYIFWYNRRWYEYTGTTFEQMQGWGWQAVHDPSHVDRVTDKFRTHLASGMPWEDTFPIRAADGRYRWFLSRAFPIRNEHGEVTLWFGTNTDVTEQMDTESALRRSNAELEQFVYVAAHDLQEPLRNISVSGDLADRKLEAGDPARPYLARMRESALRMQRLIADLLTYSRVIHHDDSGAQEADVNAAFADAVALLAERISETGSVITCDSLPRVRANQGQMAIVLQNLLANAMKYQPPGATPRIHVGATRQRAGTTITVSDNGIGFRPEYADRIFGLFKRLHTDRYEGTGLGLAVCRRIVERYQGRISAESPGEGKGATFSIALPDAGPPT
ncbi:MAG: PAS domain S-box protein [Planctomycetes bacterium]|nr:PAS domain S-box protein [Planctomycetota bacterium]